MRALLLRNFSNVFGELLGDDDALEEFLVLLLISLLDVLGTK